MVEPLPDVLLRIQRHKLQEIEAAKQRLPLRMLQQQCATAPPLRDFAAALRTSLQQGRAAVIAEIKKASPSQGVIRDDFDPVMIARSYTAAGAACLSVLTDRLFFQGSPQYLKAARAACPLPVLRKDFMLDSYQIHESRVMGADCILLIVAMLDDQQLLRLSTLAQELGMAVLVEVHTLLEVQRAMQIKPRLIGINNRNLHTFETRLETTENLYTAVPETVLTVTESGIHHIQDVLRMQKLGVRCFLVGEVLMRAQDPGLAYTHLFASASASAYSTRNNKINREKSTRQDELGKVGKA